MTKYNKGIMIIFVFHHQNPNAPGMHTADSHTRISYKEKPGIIQQIQGSLCASVLGIVLVFAAFPLLYWNEVNILK